MAHEGSRTELGKEGLSDLKTVVGTVAERQPERQEATLVWDGQSHKVRGEGEEGRGKRGGGRSLYLGIFIHQNEVVLAFCQFMRRTRRQ